MAPSTIMVTAQAYSQNKKNKDDFCAALTINLWYCHEIAMAIRKYISQLDFINI